MSLEDLLESLPKNCLISLFGRRRDLKGVFYEDHIYDGCRLAVPLYLYPCKVILIQPFETDKIIVILG